MSDRFWNFDSDFAGKHPADMLRKLIEADRKNYQKAESDLKAELKLLDKGFILYIELLQAADHQRDEWKDNTSIRASLAMGQSALDYLLLTRHGILLGYYPEVRSLLRDTHERTTRCLLFRLKESYAERFLEGKRIDQAEVDKELAELLSSQEQGQGEILRSLRVSYGYASERVHPNLESFKVRTLIDQDSDEELRQKLVEGHVFGGIMGDTFAALVVLAVTSSLTFALRVLQSLVREGTGAFDEECSKLISELEQAKNRLYEQKKLPPQPY